MRTLTRNVAFLAVTVLGIVSTAVGQANWHLAYPSQSPLWNYEWAFAFDEVHGEGILMFPRGQSNQGWRWNGTTWSSINGVLPPDRYRCYMVWDAARERVVLFGGYNTVNSQFQQDLWEWDGVSWQQRLVFVPPMRDGAAVAYDRARGVTVMFGGWDGVTERDDTWEWNGVAWSMANPGLRPSPREQVAMAFDPSTQRVLLYGGIGPLNIRLADTWTWDGATWQQQTPATPPFVRDRPAMVADLARVRVLLYGGSAYDTETWQWDGAEWHASNPGSPGAWLGTAGAYDPLRHEVVLQGGYNSIAVMNQTWIFRTANGATVTAFGNGCAGSAGVPLLANAPYSLPWIGDTVRNRVGVVAAEPGALFVTSFAQLPSPIGLGAIGMPGCDLLLPLDAIDFRSANVGFAEWAALIPDSPSVVGVPVYQQAFPLDTAANALGLAASNGVAITPGIR